jgi:predicted GNAT family N-acyltransferase
MVPAVLIGRLARDVDFPGTGRLLLLDALARSLRHSEEVAAAVMLVDAKDPATSRFYARYGFQDVLPASRRMYLPMTTVARLLGP